MTSAKKFSTIDEYHASFPEDVQEKLAVVRETIRGVLPEGQEVISYNIPAFKVHRVVVFYAANKHHLSLHPAPTGKEWEEDFKPYKTSGKGTIQFPYNQPLPIPLIQKIVKHLAVRDRERGKGKR